MVFHGLQFAVRSKIGLVKQEPPGKPQKVADLIWTLGYTFGPLQIQGKTVIVKHPRSNDLCVISGCSPTDEVLANVASLGQVTLVVIPSNGHNASAAKWKDKIPSARVSCFRDAQEFMKKDGKTWDCFNEDVLGEFNIGFRIPPQASFKKDYHEGIFLLPMDQNNTKQMLLFCDLLQDYRSVDAINYDTLYRHGAGFFGFGRVRFFRIMFQGDGKVLDKYLNDEICTLENVSQCMCLHVGGPTDGATFLADLKKTLAL